MVVGPLPLFLLRTVLFPHMPLSLHIFEERYRRMLEDCLEKGSSFGVVAIRQGKEAGALAVPRSVGTLARIVHVERLSDGRFNLLVTGASRFRILRQVRGNPYGAAQVTYLSEPDDELAPRLRKELTTAFAGYVKLLQGIGREGEGLPELPEEAEALSYLVAASMETSLEVQQQLLEATSIRERVALQLAVLRREADLIRRQVVPARVLAASFSQN
jgi:Lon protease-like protein